MEAKVWGSGKTLKQSPAQRKHIHDRVSDVLSVHIEDCEGWWLSGCCGSVAEHWRLKPGVLGLTP